MTDKEDCDIKTNMENGIYVVHFPVPVNITWTRIQHIPERRVRQIQQYIQDIYKKSILVSVDLIKSSMVADFCQVILTALIGLGQSRRGQNTIPELNVIFCANELQDFVEAQKGCKKILPSYSEDRSNSKWQIDLGSDPFSIVIEERSIETVKADAIACTISRSMKLEDGAASRSLLKQAGDDLQYELNRYPGMELGEIKELHGYKLKCTVVFVGIMAPWGHHSGKSYGTPEMYYNATVHAFVVSCLQKAADRGFKSIAFPAIGSGYLGYPVGMVAGQMFTTTHNWLYENRGGSLKTVKFVVYPADTDSLKAFQDQEKSFRKINSLPYTSTRLTSTEKCHGKTSTALSQYPASTTKMVQEENPQRVTEVSYKQTYGQFSSVANIQNGETYRTKENIIVKVYCGDLLRAQVDGIVNAANINLKHGGGIARAIEAAAGKDLTREGHEILNKNGHLKVGEACFTSAGNLKFKIVIHAVGPCWSDYSPHQLKDVDECKHDLWNAAVNSLCLAERLGLKSVAFPAISSGIYGCPEDLCCIQYAKAIIGYSSLSRHPLREIHIVDINQEMVSKIQKTCTCMITQGYPEYICRLRVFPQSNVTGIVKRHVRKLAGKVQETIGKKIKKSKDRDTQNTIIKHTILTYPSCTSAKIKGNRDVFCCAVGPKQNVFVYTENLITLQDIDMIALGETPSGKSTGTATQMFMKLAGDSYKRDKDSCFGTKKNHGDVVVCGGGGSNFKFVVHAILIPVANFPSANSIERRLAIKKLFGDIYTCMKKKTCHSLALALFGTGRGNADPQFYAERFIESFLDFCKQEVTYAADVHLVHLEREKTKFAVGVIKSVINRQPTMPSTSLPSMTSSRNDQPKLRHRASFTGDIGHVSNQSTRRPKSLPSTAFVGKDTLRNRLNINSTPVKLNVSDLDWEQYQPANDNLKTMKQLENVSAASAEEQSLHKSSEDESSDYEQDEGVNSESLSNKSDESAYPCVICMEDVTDPKQLPCGHIFCSECIEEQFIYKEACPTCGKVFGTITGDQPDGDMKILVNESASCMGFEDVGRIEIFYSFPDGIQGADHPAPGEKYKGIKRTAYLPNNKRGKEICAMLQVAFDRKLVFTLGRSRTTGADGVITWNDIHHKTDPKPNSQFGYPDPTYLDRVTDELKIKGVTLADIPSLSASTRKR